MGATALHLDLFEQPPERESFDILLRDGEVAIGRFGNLAPARMSDVVNFHVA